MEVTVLIEASNENSSVEQMIIDTLTGSKKDEICHRSSDFLVNALNLGQKKPQESAQALKTLFGQKADAFGMAAALSYYVSALEFWSYLKKQEEQKVEFREIICNVDAEVMRLKEILFLYLLQQINDEAFAHQIEGVCRNFNISAVFHEKLQEFLIGFQAEIVDQLVLQFA